VLDPNARATLRVVEAGIEADPHHDVKRHRRADGTVVDMSAEGLLVAYRTVGDAYSELLDVTDIKPTPRGS
jgi:hypothetical protein